MTQAYDDAVEKTFMSGLRSVFLVDDAFPTFWDLHKGGLRLKRFGEAERAANLYHSFRKRQLPCDVENTFRIGDLKIVERMRKCDLIVLDLHLDRTDTDASKTLHILRRLAESEHFNTVVLYTKKPDLKDVWLDVAVNLRPDLCNPRLPLEGSAHEADWWAQFDPTTIEGPTENAISSFLLNGPKAIGLETRKLIEDLKSAGATGKLSVILDAFLRYHISRREAPENKKLNSKSAPLGRTLRGRFESGKPYWVQSGGCFVAIINKERPDEEDPAKHIFDGLKAALLDWRPNFLQLLISEIQNRLELEALATDTRSFSEPTLQVGLSHYLLESIAEDPTDDAAAESTVDRIVETIRHKISGDKSLRKFAHEILVDRLESLEAKLSQANSMERAAAFAHVDKAPDTQDVLFYLNSFLSSERFNRSRITTGTVFHRAGEYWIVMSPACDLTGREPNGSQPWMRGMHPVRAMTAIKTEKVSLKGSLENATQGRSIFLRIGDEKISLGLFFSNINPAPEIFFLQDTGKVRMSKGGLTTFRAAQVHKKTLRGVVVPKIGDTEDFEVVGQLRANYASRALQLTGSHLGRIGVDFFNFEQKAVVQKEVQVKTPQPLTPPPAPDLGIVAIPEGKTGDVGEDLI